MNEIEIPEAATKIVVAEIAAWGRRGTETGGFLLCRQGGRRVERVALSGARGIRRARDQFAVSGRAMSSLFVYAEEHELTVRVQFHSHCRGAFLSRTDLDHGFSVEGFVTTVVPYFAAPPEGAGDWGWWMYRSEWSQIETPQSVDGPVGILRFDEEGTREG